MILGKRNTIQVEELIGDIVDAQPAEMIIARGDGEICEVLFANSAAKRHMKAENRTSLNCKRSIAAIFPGLCERCPNRNYDEDAPPLEPFDLPDEDGHIYSITGDTINWIDKYMATVLFMHDVNEERNADKKLYNLAYTDHLTGVPNRQKLKEDFREVESAPEGKFCGALAIFDMDNFKAINDTYGHNTGDVMLRRLTEHLQSNRNYKGHLYRLGGDEFVLLYKEPPGRLQSEEEYRAYYGDMMKEAFFSYTLPNIELTCTISMGLAFFPMHGVTISELLRKADIALYRAKAAGRNQLTIFENHFDEAKKFKDFYINIKPILADQNRTFGYELIDSGSGEDNSETLSLNELDRALDALGLSELENDMRYFIDYAQQLNSHAVSSNLPKEKFIIRVPLPEICTEEDLEAFATLRSHGYSLALDGLTTRNASPKLLQYADFAMFAPGVSLADKKEIIPQYPETRFIALNVDTYASLETASKAGFALYQGLYFNQPVVVKTKDVDPMKVNYLRLLKLTSMEGYVDFAEIANIISSDVALSYKLLRLLNSAAVGLRNRMSSIAMAVSYLGEESLKKWIALLALRGVASDKPLELVRMSLIRAQFGELLAPHLQPRREVKYVFLTGMFSLLHIALEKTREEMLADMPVAEDIRESLLTKDGLYSDLMEFFTNYEHSNWEEVAQFSSANGLASHLIYDSYIAAVKWYNDLSDSR